MMGVKFRKNLKKYDIVYIYSAYYSILFAVKYQIKRRFIASCHAFIKFN